MIIQNAIYIPSKDLYLQSVNSHDFITYTHDDGREVFIDGGKSYFRGGGDFSLYIDGTVISYHIGSGKLGNLYDRALWGSRGKNGDKPLEYRPIRTFTRDHLRNIKKHCASYMNPILLDVVKYWLKTKYNE